MLRLLVHAFFLAPLASSGEHWIDPVAGSNSNGGTSAQDAWRTLTFAIDSIGQGLPGGPKETLHLLPGTYDAANGEVFPIELRDNLELRGVGASQARIAGLQGIHVLELRDTPSAEGVGLRNLTIRDGLVGLLAIPSTQEGVVLDLESVRLLNNEDGLRSEPTSSRATLRLTADGLIARNNGRGLALLGGGDSVIKDSLLSDNDKGLLLSGSPETTGAHHSLSLNRTRVENNKPAGIDMRPLGNALGIHLEATDCLFRANFIGIDLFFASAIVGYEIRRSTVTQNVIGISPPASLYAPVLLAETIVFGNAQDNGGNDDQFQLVRSLVGVDPQFIDPGSGDFRPAFGSPAIDQGQAAADQTDIEGRTRDVDGNGDLERTSDLGAFELATLSISTPVVVGGTGQLELFGEPGGRSTVYFSRGLPEPSPFMGPFGEFYLPTNAFRLLGAFDHTPGPGATEILFPVPDIPSLLGQTFTFQAISSSQLAPAGRATTSTATFTIE